jgi:hypothetical protein
MTTHHAGLAAMGRKKEIRVGAASAPLHGSYGGVRYTIPTGPEGRARTDLVVVAVRSLLPAPALCGKASAAGDVGRAAASAPAAFRRRHGRAA